jgi:hypothetical protein
MALRELQRIIRRPSVRQRLEAIDEELESAARRRARLLNELTQCPSTRIGDELEAIGSLIDRLWSEVQELQSFLRGTQRAGDLAAP